MRRRTGPRVRTTKPVSSRSAALGPTAARSVNVPGTVTEGGTVTVTPASRDCFATAAAHAPAPPPASASVTLREALRPRRSRPNDRSAGAAKTFGSSALGRSITPPPSRTVDASVVRLSSVNAGSPVRTSADLICSTVHLGWRSRSSAAAPATCGAAMLVPL